MRGRGLCMREPNKPLQGSFNSGVAAFSAPETAALGVIAKTVDDGKRSCG